MPRPVYSITGAVDRYHNDIAIVGGGLSAASVVYALLQHVITAPAENISPLRITVFEKTENLWTGVPYGQLANKDYFLIETVEETNCPPFAHWLKTNPDKIFSYAMVSTPVVKEWYQKNREKIKEGDIDNLYFPRRVFGLFINHLLVNVVARATRLGLLKLERFRQEVADIRYRADDGFRIVTSSSPEAVNSPDATFCYSSLVLAIGSIPKKLPFNIPSALIDVDYISDNEVCACLDLSNRLEKAISSKTAKKLDLVIIGSAASAIETIFFIATNQCYLDRVRQLTVISTSGCLVGGIRAANYQQNGLPEYVSLRKSSDIYISAARKLYQQHILKVIKAQVVNVQKDNGRYTITLEQDSEQVRLPADLIINCTGSGTVDNTSSGLINNLKGKLPVNEERRGFCVDDTNMVHQFPGMYLIGPLLNRSFSGKQVESISAVFREGDIVANALFRDLSGSVEEKANGAVSAI